MEFAKSLRVPALLYPDRRQEECAEPQGIPVLFQAPAFQEQAARQYIFSPGFKDNHGQGYWDQTDHRLAWTMLAKWLCG